MNTLVSHGCGSCFARFVQRLDTPTGYAARCAAGQFNFERVASLMAPRGHSTLSVSQLIQDNGIKGTGGSDYERAIGGTFTSADLAAGSSPA